VLENGVLKHEGKPFSGNLISFYDDKSNKSNTHYLNGKKEGLEEIWYYSGVLASERFYHKNKKTGIHKGFWENRKPKFLYHFNSIGEYMGSVEEWYFTGQKYKDFNYLNGEEVGKQKLWYETGVIRANYEVFNEERFGLIGLKNCTPVTVIKEEN